jgi:hypothetical protein
MDDKDLLEACRVLASNNSFQVYIEKLQDIFDRKYKELRKCRKSDASYSVINGYLDGLEKAINLVDEEIDN